MHTTSASSARFDRSLATVFASVMLGAAGIGLTLPMLPRLMRDVGHLEELGWRFGAFTALYALMQFVFAPLLGMLSDRIGRRPVLLCSLAGGVVDYLFMAVAPTLGLLFLGRAIAGIAGASMAVASAYITDVTPVAMRSRRFAQLNAFFGLGFIAGPVIGGLLGTISVRTPFIAAALMSATNLLLACAWVRESRVPADAPAKARTAPARRWPGRPAWLRSPARFRSLLPLLAAYALVTLIGELGGTIWVMYGEDVYAWSPALIGLSLASFGVFHAIFQGLVAGPVAERWGARRALMLGMGADGCAHLLMAMAGSSWMVFTLMPLFCLGGLGTPALQTLLSDEVDAQEQGALQGMIASAAGLAAVVGPVASSMIYAASRGTYPGLIWVTAGLLYLACVPVFFRQSPRPSAVAA